MPERRILSIWFPRLAAEQAVRGEPQLADQPLAVVTETGGALVLASLTAAAEYRGLRRGMGLGDARAICPDLITRPEREPRTAAFLTALARWAGRFSPWVAPEAPESLVLDVTGCAHLFGGEAGLAVALEADAADFGLSVRLGLAGTVGAAWAVARFAGAAGNAAHAGDAIEQEARATRSRAQKRRWERGGAPPPAPAQSAPHVRIVPPGETRAHLGPLPVAALRVGAAEVAALHGLGLRRIEDVAVLPRAQVARRLGPGIVHRLDQALGRAPEPVSPARPGPTLALRLSFPEPIGQAADILAGLDRLLEPLCARLRTAGLGARRLRLTLFRTDGAAETCDAGLARPGNTAEAIRPLFALKLGDVDAGFGIEVLRLSAEVVEPLGPRQHRGRLAATAAAGAREGAPEDLADLVGRLGSRLDLEALTRLHPADSHIPEKGATVMAAAFCDPAPDWPAPAAPRPLILFPPEPVTAGDAARPPARFVWRRKPRRRTAAFGPERIAPEWWLDDPAWRSGARDYWRVETDDGTRIWLFETMGGDGGAAGWFAHGLFA